MTLKSYEDGTLFNFNPDEQTRGKILYGVVLSILTSRKKFINFDFYSAEVDAKDTKSEKFKISLIKSTKNFSGVAFVIEDVPETQTAHVYQLALVNPFLSDFLEYIKETSFETNHFEVNPDRYKQAKEKCETFGNLLKNISKHIIFKANVDVSLQTRQHAIRELGIIDLLLSISVVLYKKISFLGNETVLLSTLLSEVYNLLYNSIKSNQKNCKSIEANEQILLSQLDKGLNRDVGRILKEIFKYATMISSIKEANFTQWFKYLRFVTKENIQEQTLYLNILKFLCESSGKGQLRYQALALKGLSNPQNDFTIVKFSILNKRPVVEFDFPSKACTLRNFLEYNPKLQSKGLVIDEKNLLLDQEPTNAFFYVEDVSNVPLYSNYLSTAIEFLATICIDRYSKALQDIPAITGITLSHIALVLRIVTVSDKIRAAYANLCRVMFVDLDPFLPTSLHKERCYLWKNLEKFDDSALVQRKELLNSIIDVLRHF